MMVPNMKLVAGLNASKSSKRSWYAPQALELVLAQVSIPSFRTKDVDLYNNHETMGFKLPSTERIFTLDYLNEKPEAAFFFLRLCVVFELSFT